MKHLALLAALFASVTALGSARLRSREVTTPAGPVALTIPKRFEPLLPGSVYPDRHRPVEPKGCPVAIVERGLVSGESREFFLERGFVVAEARRETLDHPAELLAALVLEHAADPSRAVVLCRGSIPLHLSQKILAAAIFDPALASEESTAPRACALFLRTPAREPSDSLSGRLRHVFEDNAVEKWYRSEREYPREAFRDAAEWLAIEAAR